ncbi:DUF692 family multinuclear iron-containing protein [Xenorhabdus lircayensis]|uniref:DUF692 family protein n=1 Tax=Xenorhabdus lircayensis TaxID=2763499 RepID=A0ABS0U775_9GAMM|nr:DUF692 family multinuclear iron-containing protein [Xenorhabdus lircayensis]MBI6549733.1 DUF692 family protein [Xenorhabdus lircayensis]
MNSQFLHRSEDNLREIAWLINRLDKALKPIYISDHIGLFFIENLSTPQMLEINYEEDFDMVNQKIEIWQSILNTSIFLENYPSVIPQVNTQSEFYYHLIKKTSCNLLFDISNAVVADKNKGESKENWLKSLPYTQHYHIAGFEPCTKGDFFIGTHNTCIDLETTKFLEKITNYYNIETISIERDDNLSVSDWSKDIRTVHRYSNA